MGARLLGGQQRDEAGLAARVAFVDHRPPPVDHLFLHFGRAGRAGAGDEFDRREVVTPLHLLGQAQQPHEMRRHQIEPVEPVPLDVGEQALGVEALMHQHQVAEHQALHAVGGGRRMIERRDHRGAHALLDAERGLRDLDDARDLVGRGRMAHHALRPAGGAGRIGQRISAPCAADRHRRGESASQRSHSVAPAGSAHCSSVRRNAARVCAVGSTTITRQPAGTPPSIWRSRSAWMISALAPQSRRM